MDGMGLLSIKISIRFDRSFLVSLTNWPLIFYFDFWCLGDHLGIYHPLIVFSKISSRKHVICNLTHFSVAQRPPPVALWPWSCWSHGSWVTSCPSSALLWIYWVQVSHRGEAQKSVVPWRKFPGNMREVRMKLKWFHHQKRSLFKVVGGIF